MLVLAFSRLSQASGVDPNLLEAGALAILAVVIGAFWKWFTSKDKREWEARQASQRQTWEAQQAAQAKSEERQDKLVDSVVTLVEGAMKSIDEHDKAWQKMTAETLGVVREIGEKIATHDSSTQGRHQDRQREHGAILEKLSLGEEK